MSVQQRVSAIADYFRQEEDILWFMGNSDLGITKIDDGGGINSTTASNALNVTTWDLILSSLTNQIYELKDSQEQLGERYPINLIISRDVRTVAAAVQDTNDSFGGLVAIQNILRDHGNGGQLYTSKYLGGSVSRGGDGKATVTSGTVQSLLYLNSPEIVGYIDSSLVTRQDMYNIKGLESQLLQRYLPVVKDATGVLESTAVIA
jgi:hypothetical protein